MEPFSCPISAVHPDILRTQILTRLDGPTLAAVGSATSDLRNLSTDDSLWRDICRRTWPSTSHPLLCHVIDSRHRTFYASSSSALQTRHVSSRPTSPTALISAVDISYKNKHLFSKVTEMDNDTRVGLLGPSESLEIPEVLDFMDPTWVCKLGNNLNLSWILIDPARGRVGNLTCGDPFSISWDWYSGDITVWFGTVLSGEKNEELVECRAVVTCDWSDKEGLHVRQISMEIEDVEGNILGWRDSLVILHEAMEGQERRRGGERVRHMMFSKVKREQIERKWMREWRGKTVVLGCRVIIMVLIFFVMVFFFQY